MGNHSYAHLLYCDWNKRDSLLVDKSEFMNDLFGSMERLGHISDNAGDPPSLSKSQYYFYRLMNGIMILLRPGAEEFNKQLINYTPGTLSHADYTTSKDKNYRSSETIYNSIIDYERSKPAGLNGFILLMHIGAGTWQNG